MYVRKKGNMVVLILVVLFAILSSVLFVRADVSLTDCGVLNIAGERYALSNSVIAGSTAKACFHITTSNITLDCRGFMITYTGGNSVGINNTGWVNTVGGNDIGNHNVTIRNCVIFDENTGTTTNRYGIYFRFAENGTIENNIINTSHSESSGIVLESSHRNYLFNNSIKLKIPLKVPGTEPDTYSYGVLINGTSEFNLLTNNNFTNATPYSIYHNSLKPAYLKYNNSQASIFWNKTNITTSLNLSIDLNVFLDNGLAGFYPSSLPTALIIDNLNSSAKIQFKNLSYLQTPRVLKDGRRCDNVYFSPSGDGSDPVFACPITQYISTPPFQGVLDFNVTSFSNYTLQDNDPPNVTIIHPNRNNTFIGPGTFQFLVTVIDSHTSIHNVTFQFNNESWPFSRNATKVGAGYDWILDISSYSFSQGMHGFRVWANDSLNNINNTEFFNFTIDLTAPNGTFVNPANGSNFSFGMQAFNATILDNFTNVSTVLFMFNTNATPYNVTAVNQSGRWGALANLTVFPEGLHSVIIFTNDTVNVSFAGPNINNTINISFTVDLTAPNGTFVNPVNGSNFSFGMQMFNATIRDNVTYVKSVLFMFNTNATPFNATPTNRSGNWGVLVNLTVFPEGLHSAIVFANDTVDNINNTINISFTVDLTAPNGTFITANGSNFSFGMQAFNATILDNVTNVKKVLFMFNTNVTPYNVTAVNQSGRWGALANLTVFPEGLHSVIVFANDTVDNINSTINISFTVDLTAPNGTFVNPVNGSNFSFDMQMFNATIRDNVTYVKSVLFMFNTNATPFNATPTNRSGNWGVLVNLTVFPEGLHSVIVFANDSANNINNTINISFTVDLTAPNGTFVNPVNGSNFSFG
ncbi:MAG: hypothetical protein AABX64_02010, partial [Nanoarchaeota archaeon]